MTKKPKASKKKIKNDLSIIKDRARKLNKEPIVEVELSKFPLDKSKRESYLSKYNVATPPHSEFDINQLANEMLLWSFENKDALAIEDFPLSRMIAPSVFYKQADKSEYFAQALEIARCRIGSRLQKLARDGMIDPRFVLKILPLYHEDYKNLLMAKIKNFQKSIAPAPVKVVIEEFVSQ
jgi:hypothetical protein